MNTDQRAWSDDRAFFWSLTLLLAASVAWTVFPPGFNWPAEDAHAQTIEGEVGEGSLARKLQWLPLFAMAGIVVLYRAKIATMVILRSNPFPWGFVLWCAATILWSVHAPSTMKKVIQLFGVLAIAVAFQSASWTPMRFETVVRNTIGWIVLLSVPFALILSDIGVHHGGDTDGKWKGLTTNKNELGLIASFGFIFYLHEYLRGDSPLLRASAWMGLCLFVMVMAQSGTAFGVAAVCCLFVLLVMRPPIAYHGRLLAWSLALITFLLGGYLVWTLVDGPPGLQEILGPIAALFGKDITLTGRSNIWALVLEEAARHPIHGIGFGAFWLGPDSASGWITDILYWVPWQGHNTYIDIYNETGLVGLSLVIGFLLFHCVQLQRVSRLDRSAFALHATLFLYLLLSNIVETKMFRPITVHLLLLAMSSLSLTRLLLEQELRNATRSVAAAKG